MDAAFSCGISIFENIDLRKNNNKPENDKRNERNSMIAAVLFTTDQSSRESSWIVPKWIQVFKLNNNYWVIRKVESVIFLFIFESELIS